MEKEALAGITGAINVARGLATGLPGLKQIYGVSNAIQMGEFGAQIGDFATGGKFNLTNKLTNLKGSVKSVSNSLISNLPAKHQTALRGVGKGLGKVVKLQNTADLLGLGATGIDVASNFFSGGKQRQYFKPMEPGERYDGALKNLNFSVRQDNLMKSKMAGLIRTADLHETAYILEKCINDYSDNFLLKTARDIELLQKNLFLPETLISGDLTNLNGFINYSIRPMTKSASNTLYIRTVAVSPKCKGMGFAKELIDTAIKRASINDWDFSDGVWMQICPDNFPMKKVASKSGFSHVSNWEYNNSIAEIWHRRI